MKKWLSLAAGVVLCLALVIGAACGGGGEGEEEEEGLRELKWGIGIPLTGSVGAAVGIAADHAFHLGAEKVGVFTVGGEQYRWKLIVEDNLWSTAGGTAAAMKFVYEYDVDFMHQAGADPGVAAQQICEEKGIILDIAAASREHFGPDRPHCFQVAASWSLHAPVFFDWVTKNYPEVKRIALEASDDVTGYCVTDALEEAAEHYGLEIVAKEFSPSGTLEYFPVATKLMAKNPDLVITGAAAIAIMRDMGYEGLASMWYPTIAGIEQEGWDRLQGTLIWIPYPYGEWRERFPEAAALVDEFQDRWGFEMHPAAFWASNVVYCMTGALMAAGTVDDTDKIIESMESGVKYHTTMGDLKYGGEAIDGVGHMIVWPTPIVEISGEGFHVITEYTPDETEAIASEVYK